MIEFSSLWIIGVWLLFGCGAIALICLVGLIFCDIRYSRFSGEAAEKIRECQKELDSMFTM